MIALPKKRDPVRSGILRAVKREWPKHRRFIRSRCCVVTLGKVHDDCDGPIECAHYRTAANAGKSQKPHDWYCFSACRKHHAEQHRIGQPAFERKYGLSLAEICAVFARLSTDTAMLLAMKECAAC
jgi:hypothetical protein